MLYHYQCIRKLKQTTLEVILVSSKTVQLRYYRFELNGIQNADICAITVKKLCLFPERKYFQREIPASQGFIHSLLFCYTKNICLKPLLFLKSCLYIPFQRILLMPFFEPSNTSSFTFDHFGFQTDKFNNLQKTFCESVLGCLLTKKEILPSACAKYRNRRYLSL